MKPDSRQPAVQRESRWPVGLIVGLVVAITPVLVYVSDGNAGVAIAPVLAVGLVYLLWAVPVRYPTLTLLFLGLVVENPADPWACGFWESPLRPVRQLFFVRWNQVLPVPPLVFSGMDLMLAMLIGIAWYRRATHQSIDGPRADPANPLPKFYLLAVLGGLLGDGWGVVQGGYASKFAFIQLQHDIYPVLYFFLYHLALRVPRDNTAIAKVVISAALIRAAVAFGIRHLVTPHDILNMPHTTSHGDSILFACAFCLCVTIALQMRDKKSLRLCALVLPILCLGMIANNRRLVWVQTGEAMVALYFVLPSSPIKRKFLRLAVRILPIFAIYVAAGWNSSARVFAGAHTIRSLVDSDSDGSTKWRDFENLDLVTTVQSSPILGIGYGHPYLMPVNVAADIAGYELEPYQPHNSLLGLWAYSGVVGFTLLWLVVVVGVFLAVRCYKRATQPEHQAAALAIVATAVIYMTHCYGDVGYSAPQSVLLMPLGFCVAGKLASVTGAWPSRSASAPLSVS